MQVFGQVYGYYSSQTRQAHGSLSIVWMDITLLHRKVRKVALDRRHWVNVTLRVQVPKNHILTQDLYCNYNYYYPNPKYLIIGYLHPKP